MPQKMTDIVLFGKETTRGTKASTFPLHMPFLGQGLVPQITQHVGEILSSSTWPYDTKQVPLGATARLTFTPEFNINTIRSILTMVTKRTSGVQPSVSITHTRAGVGHAQYLGVVAAALSMEYSRSGSPDASSVLQGSMDFECMSAAETTGVSAGTQANARRFKLQAATLTLNSVACTKVLSYRRSMTIEHALGAPDSNNARIFLEDGRHMDEVNIVAQFNATDADWLALILAGTEVPLVVVHATGTANETVTETFGTAQIVNHTLNEQDGTIIVEIAVKPYHTGAAIPDVITYGSLIGADTLLL
ncbi:MAG: hypothetical protein KF841_14160 [Phycisphaerae bacterium]|nr:hypothetical protein [Phycisphaerae bacterium]